MLSRRSRERKDANPLSHLQRLWPDLQGPAAARPASKPTTEPTTGSVRRRRKHKAGTPQHGDDCAQRCSSVTAINVGAAVRATTSRHISIRRLAATTGWRPWTTAPRCVLAATGERTAAAPPVATRSRPSVRRVLIHCPTSRRAQGRRVRRSSRGRAPRSVRGARLGCGRQAIEHAEWARNRRRFHVG